MYLFVDILAMPDCRDEQNIGVFLDQEKDPIVTHATTALWPAAQGF